MIVYALLAVSLIVLIIIGVPVGFGAGIISTIGAATFFGDFADQRVPIMIARSAFAKIDNFLLLAIPFFLLAGRLMNTGGITNRLFTFVSITVRPLKGGLGHANVLASMIFAGMSGSATADAVGLGTVEMRAMLEQGYDRKFSAAITAASSLIGPIIPPSIAMVAYGVMAEESIGALFFGGIVPGIVMALAFMAYVAYCAYRYNYPSGALPSLEELWVAFRRGFFPLLTPVIIVGGIYSGVFTPTEAAAVAAFYAMFLGLFIYREYGWRHLLAEIRGTMIDTAVIMLIIAFTSTFGVVMIRGQVPTELANLLARLTDNPTVLLLLFTVFWLIVGFFMAQTPAILILTPILLPTAEQFGIDPVHFGVVMTLALTLGLLTPPVGMVLYALVRVTGVNFEGLVKISVPYVLITLGVVVLLILFPQLVLFLPRALM
ncbi:MAG: TRAP transporter large permease subunit [Deltaproteobacteria bacterium]|nr:TRAP transporter large permease subunit [Deltaproteobacteria bacterium]